MITSRRVTAEILVSSVSRLVSRGTPSAESSHRYGYWQSMRLRGRRKQGKSTPQAALEVTQNNLSPGELACKSAVRSSILGTSKPAEERDTVV